MISERGPKKYCSEPLENIENYEQAVNDTENLWACHHRAEILPCGRYSREALKRAEMYWNRPASELIFLRHEEHCRIHHKGIILSEEHRHKIAESNKGKSSWNKGKSSWNKGKIGWNKGKPAWNKGKKMGKPSMETRRKLSESNHQKKNVEMTRLADGFIREFHSMIEAVKWLRENGFPKAAPSAIRACCNNRQHTAYDAKWRYANGLV